MAKHVQALLPDDLADWVDETFEHGQRGAFVVACFENLRRLMTEGTLPPPSEYARRATLLTVERWSETER